MPMTKMDKLFDLKGNMITMPVLYLYGSDVNVFTQQLSAMVAQSPKLFHHSPLTIDLSKAPQDQTIPFSDLVEVLRSHDIIPVAVRHGTDAQHQSAKEAGLGILHESKPKATQSSQKPSKSKVKPQGAMIINKPVRSGQQVYANGTDLVIVGSVSSAAEVIADGCIIVYGTLNGRAIAGASGNIEARILCADLRADLVSIAGHYKTRDEMEEKQIPKSKYGTQVFLDKQHLCVQKI